MGMSTQHRSKEVNPEQVLGADGSTLAKDTRRRQGPAWAGGDRSLGPHQAEKHLDFRKSDWQPKLPV